jgi:hypothetical protein
MVSLIFTARDWKLPAITRSVDEENLAIPQGGHDAGDRGGQK